MKVLVTGARGFIGSHLVKQLKSERHEIAEFEGDPAMTRFRGTFSVMVTAYDDAGDFDPARMAPTNPGSSSMEASQPDSPWVTMG